MCATHARFQESTAAGVFANLWEMSLQDYDELNGIDWSWQAMDGAITTVPLSGETNRPQPHRSGQRRRQTERPHGGVGRAHWRGD